MKKKEALERLQAISEMIDRYLNSGMPVLVASQDLLEKIQSIALAIEDDSDVLKKVPVARVNHYIISCDASIKKNPGGPSSIGVVIDSPNPKDKRREMSQGTPAKTNNQAEIDAIYIGLTTLVNLKNRPEPKIEVRSDSQLVINLLNGDYKCHDEILKKRRNSILELVQAIPVPVEFVWRPRNSTPELELANFLAQDYLGIKRH